jgi:hypothetical protein
MNSMLSPFLLRAATFCALLASLAVSASRGQNVITSGNFETGTAGAVPPSPWTVTAPSGQGSGLISSGSSIFGNVFSIGSKSVVLTDAATDTNANPVLSQVFPTQTVGPLTLNFDFRVEGTLQNSAWVIDLRPANGASSHIRFVADYAGNNFQIQNGGSLQTVTHLVSNTWYNVRANIDLLSKTYSGTITSYSGVASSWTNAAFGTANADVGMLVISDGAPSATAPPLRLDNFYLGKRKGATDGLAEGLIADDFDDYVEGTSSTPPAPWSFIGATGVTFNLDATAESPFISNTISGKGLVVTDTSTTGGASAGFEQRFLTPPAADPLLISFDFQISNSGSNDLTPTFRLGDASGTSGIFLALWSGGWLANTNPNNTSQNLQAITLGTWYHAVITTGALNSPPETYTLKITPFGGSTVTYSGLPFRVNLANAGKISFANGSGGAGTGQWTIDNVIMGGVVDQPRVNSWPFTQPTISSLRAAPKKVFAHWFSTFPILINYEGDPGRDYYNQHYLNPSGESNSHAAGGGFLRDRPLPRATTTISAMLDEDVRVAARLGIDGFSMDILATSGPIWDRLVNMMNRAAAVDPGFKILLMPDMVALKSYDTQAIDAIRMMASYPAAYRLSDGRLVVSPYNAQARDAAWWQTQLNQLASEGINVAFVPLFQGWFAYKDTFAPISYGFGEWGVRVPIWNNPGRFNFPSDVHQYVPVSFAPVAPQDSRPKSGNFTEAGNSDCFYSEWDSAISKGADWVQLITWSDYSENSHIEPSSRIGYAFYDKTAYYTTWFKTGAPPAITRDVLYYTFRRHKTDTLATSPQTPNPFTLTGGTPAQNEVEVTAFLKSAGTLEIDIAGSVTSTAVNAGITSFSVPMISGRPVFRLKRNSHVILEGAGQAPINYNIEFQDMLYWSGVITGSAPP